MTLRKRRSPVERHLPVFFGFVAIGLAVALLPTALRPPPDQQNSSASLSPDSPPDEPPPESILQSVRQAASSAGGAGTGAPVEEVVEEPPPPPPPPKRPVRGRCFGDPPRQTESLYSAPCVPAFTGGDNGGATARGVLPDEIRIAIAVDDSTFPEGPLDHEFRDGEAEDVRRLKVWQIYFNERFEFYGRTMRFYLVYMSSTDPDQSRAAVTEAVTGYSVFALIGDGTNLPSGPAAAEAARQKTITFVPGHNPIDYYAETAPYSYSFDQDAWQLSFLTPELACKQFVGKPPGLLNERMDTSFDYNAPRRWGLIIYQDEVRRGADQRTREQFAKCGAQFELVQEYNLTDNQQRIAGVAAKMKAAGVTSIMVGVDYITPLVLTAEAQRLNYFPEWIGAAGYDTNSTGRNLDDTQARHTIAISSKEIARADEDKDWFRAYKEIDPDGEPSRDYFRDLQQLSGGIQSAGPKLTAETFWDGLRKQPCRTPDPVWSIGGCYRSPDPRSDLFYLGDFTYSDWVLLRWFDNAGDDPNSSSAGAWCEMYSGSRFQYGTMPSEPAPWFDKSQCIYSPPAGVNG